MESNLKIEEERIETISNRVIRTFQKRSDFIPSLKFFISKSNRLAESNSKERRIETISKGTIHIAKIYSYIYMYTQEKLREISKKQREREKKYSGANIRRGNLSEAIRSSETDKC